MRNMRKAAALVTAICLASGILTGCQGGKTEPAATGGEQTTAAQATEAASSEESKQPEEAGGDQVTLRFAWWGGDSRHEATLKAIEVYEAKNPNVKIEGEYQGYDGYYEKMVTTLSSGTAPDLFQFHRDWVADVQGAKHYLADLSKLPVDTSTLTGGVLDKSGMYNGEPVLFPCSVGGQVIYANSEFAEKYNLDTSKSYTWTEFIELGKQIQAANPEDYLMTADIDVLNRLIIVSYIAQLTGGSLVDAETYELNFTEEQMTEALQNILNLYSSGTLEPFGESAVFVGQMEQNTKWVNGKIGGLLDITGACSKYQASVSAEVIPMQIPILENAKSSGVDYSGNMGFCINDNSANKEEAAKFLDWIENDPEAILILTDTRGFPSTTSAINALSENNLMNETLKKAVEIAEPNSFSINAVSSNTELETIRKDIIQEVIYGDITPEEGAKEIVEQYTEVLDGLKTK